MSFPIAPVRTRQTGNGNERVLDQRTENGLAVRQLSFMDFQSLVTTVGTFEPDNMDPEEFLSKKIKIKKLEKWRFIVCQTKMLADLL